MKNNFDDILKKKWDEFHFPVDEDHRRDMIHLLDQSNRRRTGLAWWLSGVGVIILLAVFTLFVIPGKKPGNPVAPGNSSDQSEMKEDRAEVNEKHNDAFIDQPEVIYNSNSHTSTDAEVNKNEPGLAMEENKIISTLEAKVDDIKSNISHNKTKHTNIQISKSSPDNNFINAGKEHLKADESLLIHNSTSEPENIHSAVVVESLKEERFTTQSIDDVKTAMREAPYISLPVETVDLNGISYDDKVQIEVIKTVVAKNHPLSLFGEFGTGYVSASDLHYATGWTVKAGGGIEYGLSPKSSISFSGGYLLQKNGFEFERTSTVQQSTFGVRSNFNSLSPDKLHFVYVNLGAHHKLARHRVSLFGGAQYLYGAQGDIVINSTDQLTGMSQTTKYAWLKLDGINRLLLNMEAQYGYQVSPRLSLYAGIKYNFSPIVATNDDLRDKGYYWFGKFSQVNPVFTIKYMLYETR